MGIGRIAGICLGVLLASRANAADTEQIAEIFGGEAKLKDEATRDPLAASAYLLFSGFEDSLQNETSIPELARAYAEAGQYDRAMQMARTLITKYQRMVAFILIAEEGMKGGAREKAKEAVEEGLKVIAPDLLYDRGITDLAMLLIRLGEFKRGLQTLKSLRGTQERIYALSRIGLEYKKAGRHLQAEEMRILQEITKARRPAP